MCVLSLVARHFHVCQGVYNYRVHGSRQTRVRLCTYKFLVAFDLAIEVLLLVGGQCVLEYLVLFVRTFFHSVIFVVLLVVVGRHVI